jgi:hypothetical protein
MRESFTYEKLVEKHRTALEKAAKQAKAKYLEAFEDHVLRELTTLEEGLAVSSEEQALGVLRAKKIVEVVFKAWKEHA